MFYYCAIPFLSEEELEQEAEFEEALRQLSKGSARLLRCRSAWSRTQRASTYGSMKQFTSNRRYGYML